MKKSYRFLSLLLAVLLVIGLLPAMVFAEGETPAVKDGDAYAGETLIVVNEAGEESGMFKPGDDSTLKIEGDKVIIHYAYTKTTYKGLHWGTDKVNTVNYAYDSTAKSFEISLDKSACGKYNAFYGVKAKDDTLSSQMFLAIPSEDIIKASQSSEDPQDPSGDTPTEPADDRIALSIYDEELMFKVVNAYITKVDGKDCLVFAMNSTGYEDFFAGTYEQAIANGKNKDNWIHFTKANVDCTYETKDGVQKDGVLEKYQFAMPVQLNASGETKIPVVAISKTKAADAEKANPDSPDYSKAFFARQFVIDIDKKTIRTGNLKETSNVTVTSEVSDFSIDSKKDATLYTEGSSTANEFKSYITVPMSTKAYTKAFLGKATDAGKKGAKTIELKDGVFELNFHNTLGESAQIENNKAVAAFYVADGTGYKEAGTWIERTFTFDYENKTVTVTGKALTCLRQFPYDGNEVTFQKADGSAFGMWAPQEGTEYQFEGEDLIVHIVPKNVKTYGWIHWGLTSDEKLTQDYKLNSDGTMDLTLNAEEYCGYGSAVAPLKKSDPTATTSEQYYLVVPAIAEHDKSVTLKSAKDASGAELTADAQYIFKFEGLTPKEAVSLNSRVKSEKDIEILWQKDVNIVTEEVMTKGSSKEASSVTLTFTVSGLEVEQEIYLYHCVDGKWTYVGYGKDGKIEAELDSLSPIALAVSAPQQPKTGDSSSIFLWAAIAVCAAACVLVVSRKRREEY